VYLKFDFFFSNTILQSQMIIFPVQMNRRIIAILLFWITGLLLFTCDPAEENVNRNSQEPTLFELLTPEATNITFQNRIVEGLNTNVLMYEYFYNGAGVSAGDLNNDGLEDLVFTSNMENNTLYLNMGNFEFKEVGAVANIQGRPGPWKTGVTMADVNGDGLQDLYICYSGKMAPQKLINQLLINQGTGQDGIPRFIDRTRQYGLEFPTNTTHAVFFDFDRDGDLDLFILNHHPDSLPKLNEEDTEEVLKIDDQVHGVRLLRNDNGIFKDITIEAGFISSPITYGLGAGVADIDLDGWTDIYICNDFSLPDYLYINNGDGTFTDRLQEKMGHTSYASMGNNVADVNNDGLPDIFSLDMLPEDNRRQKLLLAPNDYDFFDLNLRLGFYYQYLRSMLQLNNGNGTFSEIGQIAGIAATDWSWAPVFADYDNDGWKDLLITNGYLRDYTNMDFLRNMDMFVKSNQNLNRNDVLHLVNTMPETELFNYIFRNNKNSTFSQTNTTWGLTEGSYSNGTVYVDLDNDGDLEIVTRNINKPVFIYENKSNELTANNYLKIKLKGSRKNRFGMGAKVYVYSDGQLQMLEQQTAKGYQSSVTPVLHFGLGEISQLDSVKVIWLGGMSETKTNISSGQTIEFNQENAGEKYVRPIYPESIFSEVKSPVDFTHKNPALNDFKRQPLMLNAKSFEGPCMASGDINNDGLEDLFIGGGPGQAGKVFVRAGTSFREIKTDAFYADRKSDDVDALFFDANGDGHVDLYVCSGGYHNYRSDDNALEDRLYLNNGRGRFIKAENAIPENRTSSGSVAAGDVNRDGSIDLFVGGFVVPGRYPEIPSSALLINDGQGKFSNQTKAFAPQLEKAGMVSDAKWEDLNSDGNQELILAGLWMPITIYGTKDEKFIDQTEVYFSKRYSGFWNELLIDDFNYDGKPDIVAGNLGKNSQMQATFSEPADLYFKDFDNNGSIDPIICFHIQGTSYPYVTRKELIAQIPRMEQKFPTFESYANATIRHVFTSPELKDAGHLVANHATTSYFEQNAEGVYVERSLPIEAQYAPIYTINSFDFNEDGHKDLLLCGNINNARIRFGKYDANYGLLLQGDGNGEFQTVVQYRSGFKLKGDVRSSILLNDMILFGINNQNIKAYKLNKK
jgi:hypothetical protein